MRNELSEAGYELSRVAESRKEVQPDYATRLDVVSARLNSRGAAIVTVAAYVPMGEEHAVLSATIDGVAVGIVYRRGERGYELLLAACCGSPKWIFGQQPSPLS